MAIPTRPLGSTDVEVSILGVGGAHLSKPDESEAIRIVQEAIDGGVTFMDNAWEYGDGESERRMGKALAESNYRQRAFLMTKDCAHDRRAEHSMRKLEESLQKLRTDYLDLWQLHEVVWEDDPERILAPGGSLEALMKAKEQGKVRFIGFTGHKSPHLHRQLLDSGIPWETVQMPLNVFDAHFSSFQHKILPICLEQGIGVIGMKSNAGGHVQRSGSDITPEEALRYSLGLPASVVVSGMESVEILRKNMAVADEFVPYSEEELDALLERARPDAEAGEFEPFKTSHAYDGAEGRKDHNYPLDAAD
ncbi:MAG TPA: aldo/keto reductase [Thermomicrobiales bacterium]|nr:aldo/keto reductase [Thermomicrobiales bacterium]